MISLFGVSSNKGTIPIMRAPPSRPRLTLITSQRHHFQIPSSHGGLELQHKNLVGRGTQTFSSNSTYAVHLCICTCMNVPVHTGVFVSMSMHAFHVCACLCKFHVYAYRYIGMCMYAYVQVCACEHVLCLCMCIVHLSVYTQVRGWETPSQVSCSAAQPKSPVKVRVTQSELRRGFGELGPKS